MYRSLIQAQKAGFKGWWRLSNSLLNRAGSSRDAPALEGATGWARSPADKANLLSQTLRNMNVYSVLITVQDSNTKIQLPLPRVKNVARVLEELSDAFSTGPDGIPTRFLMRCSQ